MLGIFKRKHFIIAAIIIVTILILYVILPVAVPLIVALITALFLEPVVKLLGKRLKFKRHFIVMIVFTVFTLIIGTLTFFTTTKLIGQGVKLVEDSPQYINNIMEIWADLEERFQNAAQHLPVEMIQAMTEEVNSFMNTIMTSLRQNLNIENISAALSYIPNFLVSFLVYLIALFLFMIELPKIKSEIYDRLTEETSKKVSFMTERLSAVVFGFFKAQFLVSIIIFISSFIGLLFISPRTALIMSVIIWIIDLIPIIGSIVILGPWALYHLLVGNIVIGTKLAILAAVLLIIRRTVEPKVMGTQMGLSPLATLIAMYLGLKLVGILGFIIGPLLLILFKTAREAGIIKLNFKI